MDWISDLHLVPHKLFLIGNSNIWNNNSERFWGSFMFHAPCGPSVNFLSYAHHKLTSMVGLSIQHIELQGIFSMCTPSSPPFLFLCALCTLYNVYTVYILPPNPHHPTESAWSAFIWQIWIRSPGITIIEQKIGRMQHFVLQNQLMLLWVWLVARSGQQY